MQNSPDPVNTIVITWKTLDELLLIIHVNKLANKNNSFLPTILCQAANYRQAAFKICDIN